jgi:hypothetical protein
LASIEDPVQVSTGSWPRRGELRSTHLDPHEANPRVRSADRGVRRDGSSNGVDLRGKRRNSEGAGPVDPHASVPAYVQRPRANHDSSHTALDGKRDSTRATVQRARSRFQHSELEKAGVSARAHNRSWAASDLAAGVGGLLCSNRSWSRSPLRRDDNPRAWAQARNPEPGARKRKPAHGPAPRFAQRRAT